MWFFRVILKIWTQIDSKHDIKTRCIQIKESAYHNRHFLSCITFPSLSLSKLSHVLIRVEFDIYLSFLNLFSSSLHYFLINESSFLIDKIFNLRNYRNSPIMNILNSIWNILEYYLHKDSLIAPKMISSTYVCTSKMLCLVFLIKRVVSTFPFWKLF